MTGRVLLRLRPVRIVRALSSEQRHDRYTGLLFLSAGGGALVILPAARVPALTHTGLGAMSRIRCGTGPISVRITTDLEVEVNRSRDLGDGGRASCAPSPLGGGDQGVPEVPVAHVEGGASNGSAGDGVAPDRRYPDRGHMEDEATQGAREMLQPQVGAQ